VAGDAAQHAGVDRICAVVWCCAVPAHTNSQQPHLLHITRSHTCVTQMSTKLLEGPRLKDNLKLVYDFNNRFGEWVGGGMHMACQRRDERLASSWRGQVQTCNTRPPCRHTPWRHTTHRSLLHRDPEVQEQV
jgi:hypothetical protein